MLVHSPMQGACRKARRYAAAEGVPANRKPSATDESAQRLNLRGVRFIYRSLWRLLLRGGVDVHVASLLGNTTPNDK